MREWIEKVRAHIEARELTSSGVAALVVAGLTTLAEQSLWVIALSGIVAFAAMPWGFIGWRELEKRRYQPIDFQKWDRVDQPALWQAACIYDDIEPYTPLVPGTPCYASLQMLKSAIMNGELTVTGEFGGTDTWQRLKRDDLKAYAEKRGDRPKSLFAEDR